MIEKVESITISSQGQRLYIRNCGFRGAGSVPDGTVTPVFDVIMSPQGGHGADIYMRVGSI